MEIRKVKEGKRGEEMKGWKRRGEERKGKERRKEKECMLYVVVLLLDRYI